MHSLFLLCQCDQSAIITTSCYSTCQCCVPYSGLYHIANKRFFIWSLPTSGVESKQKWGRKKLADFSVQTGYVLDAMKQRLSRGDIDKFWHYIVLANRGVFSSANLTFDLLSSIYYCTFTATICFFAVALTFVVDWIAFKGRLFLTLLSRSRLD